MKNSDIYWGVGIFAVAYLFLRPKQVAPGVSTAPPVYTALPQPQQQNAGGQIVPILAAFAPSLIKLLAPSPTAPQQTAPVNQYIDIPAPYVPPVDTPVYTLPTELPGLAYQQEPTALESYFQNGDYPGAEMSGVSKHRAGRLGLY